MLLPEDFHQETRRVSLARHERSYLVKRIYKKLTKEEKKQAKTNAAEKRMERRDGKKCSKKEDLGTEHGQRRVLDRISGTSFTQ